MGWIDPEEETEEVRCPRCKQWVKNLLDNRCGYCYADEQEAIYRQALGDDVVDDWSQIP